MRLGVFGGTFDPIHYGHLRLAEEARDRLGLDRVLFVPNQVSPFKAGATATPGRQRAQMTALAIGENPAFGVWEGELDREGPSYTVETLRALAAEHPGDELFFLTGTDAVRDLPKWREPEALLALARFVVATRPGVTGKDVLAALPDSWEPRLVFLPMGGLDISSTDLRERVAGGRSIRYLTAPAVIEFIGTHGLYAAPAGER